MKRTLQILLPILLVWVVSTLVFVNFIAPLIPAGEWHNIFAVILYCIFVPLCYQMVMFLFALTVFIGLWRQIG